MKVFETELPGVLLVEPQVFGDHRGFFIETFHADRYRQWGIPGPFVQDNYSRSYKGVLRGLHFQLRHPQGKLVQVTRGEAFDVAVDIRRGSPTFGHLYSTTLSDDNHRQLYVPPGFAHGFCALAETVDFMYKCTEFYHPEDEGGVLSTDPDLGIQWPVSEPQLTESDAHYPRLRDLTDEQLPVFTTTP
jgi:dTDP-4-dehydrorhamnose 3,5-epimerase